MLFCTADLPFSFVGDVVTWPYTAAYSCINQPIPTPPVTHASTGVQLQIYVTPENKVPEKKTPEKYADQGKQRDENPAPLPIPLPPPLKQTP